MPWEVLRVSLCLTEMIRSLAPFDSKEMEQEFEAEVCNVARSMCTNWCLGNVIFFGFGLTLHILHCLAATWMLWQGGALVVFSATVATLSLLVAMMCALHCASWLRPYLTKLMCWLVVVLVVLTTVITHAMIAAGTTVGSLPLLAEAIQGNEAAHTEFLQYVSLELSKKYLMMQGMQLFFILHILQHVPYNKCVLTLHVVIPIALALANVYSPVIPSEGRLMVVVNLSPFLFSLFNCANTMGLRRSNFKANYQLQAALAQEARALQKARDLEVAQKEASQKADSILNHILKNIMADAVGCVELYLGGAADDSRVLHQAADCLYRGMRWCKQRQAILRIASGCYSPALAPISLQALGDSLVAGRHMAHRFLEGTFLLDSTLCGIVLDNAISNAFRHGHPEDPEVTFTMSVAVLPGEEDDGSRFRLTFEITNRVAPLRPPMTRDLLHRLLSGSYDVGCISPSTTLSDHFGLRHMFAAAEIHGMEVTLQQLGEHVVFEASLEADMCGDTLEPAATQEDLDQVPLGLRIVCLDDSPVARKLLTHSLRTHVRGSIVTVYGATEDEVEIFVEAALASADVVVLDQNVTFGATNVLGTNVVHCLLSRGFAGFICIRSANSAAEDEAAYLASGAHCVLGKDLPPAELAMRLQIEFLRRKLALMREVYKDAPIRPRLVIQARNVRRASPQPISESGDASSGITTDSAPLTPSDRSRPVTLPGVPDAAAYSEHHSLLIVPSFRQGPNVPAHPFV